MTLTLKNPPFDTCPFNFFVLFYMFGVVRDGDILQLILDQLPPDMINVGIYYLSKAIFRHNMYGVLYTSFAEMAVSYMNERAAVTERLTRLIAEIVIEINTNKIILIIKNRTPTSISICTKQALQTLPRSYHAQTDS